MTSRIPTVPFGNDTLPDYKLSNSPLARMIVQVIFPRSTDLAAESQTINEIARALRDDYPTFAEGSEVEFEITPAGPKMRESPRWQFTTFSEAESVIITPTSVAFDSRVYLSRDDMLAKLRPVIEATLKFARPAHIVRVGVRYTNQVSDVKDVKEVASIFREPLLAGLTIPIEGASISQTITHTVVTVSPEVSLSVRSGKIPPMAQLDPGHDPMQQESFLLDLDAFRPEKQQGVNADVLIEQVSSLAEVVYRFFLWSLTEEGLERFGGQEIGDSDG